MSGVHQRVAHGRAADVLDAGDDIADFPGRKHRPHRRLGRERADIVHHVAASQRLHDDLVALSDLSLHHPHQRDDAEVVVEPGVDDERLERCLTITFRRWDLADQPLEQLRHALPRLGADADHVVRGQTDDLLDLLGDPFRLGLGQIDLVQHGQHLEALLDRGVAVGHRLSLHPLSRVHDQQRSLAGGQRAGHLVAEVHVSGGVDEVELVVEAVLGAIVQRHAVGLDGDAPLPLEIHGIEHLLGHLAIAQATAELDQAIRQGRLAMVDVGDDREVADLFDVCGHSAPVPASRVWCRRRASLAYSPGPGEAAGPLNGRPGLARPRATPARAGRGNAALRRE